MNKLHRKILIGDVLEKMLEIPDESIDVIISSPPYWGLRDYGADGQWGLEKDFHEYLDKLDKLMDQCKRVLKSTGTCWINLGDTYSTVSGGMRDLKNGVKKKYGKVDYGVGHAHTGDDNPERAGAFSVDQAKMYNNLQSKSRVGIPERFYIRCIDKGWIARNHIPWVKANSMPSSVKDRFANKWESVFFFAKNKKYYFDLDAVRVEPITKIKPKPFNRRIRDAKRLENMNQDGAIVGAEATRQEKLTTDKLGNKLRGMRIKISDIQETTVGEVITEKPFKEESNKIIATKVKIGDSEVNVFSKEVSRLEHEVYGKDDMQNGRRSRVLGFLNTTGRKQNANPNGKNPGDIFNINTKPFPKAHFATFPPALPEKILKCSCPKQVCKKCGKPREPIKKPTTEYQKILDDKPYETMPNELRKHRLDQRHQGNGLSGIKHNKEINSMQRYEITGYTECSCKAGFEAGIALDPFFGAGTVGLVAEELGLDWVGIELKEEYTKIARERLEPYTEKRNIDEEYR